MKSIAAEIAELAAMAVPELIARYNDLFGKTPRVKQRAHLLRRIAWELQARRFGGLSGTAKATLASLMADIELPGTPPTTAVTEKLTRTKPGALQPGTTLVRVWHGQEVRVKVLADGVEWNGTPYRSLSAVARAITGTHWNGHLFFGLAKRKATGG